MLASILIQTITGRLIPVLLAAVMLAGCSGRPPDPQPTTTVDELTTTADDYLQQIEQSNSAEKPTLQLLAARALLHEGKVDQAADQLNTLPQQLTDVQHQEYWLIQADIALVRHNRMAALLSLDKIHTDKLTPGQTLRYYQLQLNANQEAGTPTLEEIRRLIAQEPELTPEERQVNLEQTWRSLRQISSAELNQATVTPAETILQGWLVLRQVYQDNQQDPDQLKIGVDGWRNSHPQHPATLLQPTQLQQTFDYLSSAPLKIALLLPLSGEAKVYSQAIEQGFNAAARHHSVSPSSAEVQPTENTQQFSELNDSVSPLLSPPPFTDTSRPDQTLHATNIPQSPAIKVYDTSLKPLSELLKQVEQEGATLVVGPLLKPQVEQLSSIDTSINILALNQPATITARTNICYFSLSPEDEARDAARHIRSQGKRFPLVLVPKENLGKRVARAFAEGWQQEGESTALLQTFGSITEMKARINQGLGIHLSGQPLVVAEYHQPITVAGIPSIEPSSVAAPDDRVDAVYILATHAEIVLIKSMLNMNRSTTRPTLYASTRSYQSSKGTDYRLELDELEFSDIPLLAGDYPELQQQISSQFNNDYMLVRLYAMGMDAWTLANHFNQMKQVDGFQINGYTGTLHTDQHCVISRKQSWLKFHQGQIVQVL